MPIAYRLTIVALGLAACARSHAGTYAGRTEATVTPTAGGTSPMNEVTPARMTVTDAGGAEYTLAFEVNGLPIPCTYRVRRADNTVVPGQVCERTTPEMHARQVVTNGSVRFEGLGVVVDIRATLEMTTTGGPPMNATQTNHFDGTKQ